MWKKIFNNWPMKLLALALAVPVWFYANSVVIRTTQVEVYFDVDSPASVDAQAVPGDRHVMLTVSGPTAVIEELSRRNLQVAYKVANVENLREDRVDTVRFTPDMVVNLPAQAQVHAFSPESFTLTLRRVETRRLPVKPPKIEGLPAPGYEVGIPEIRGSTEVLVTGPVSVLRRIRDERQGVDPEPVDVTHHTEPIRDRKLRIQTFIRFDNSTTEQVHCDETVDVFVDIHPAAEAALVKGLPVSVLAAPGSPVDVEITSGNPIDLPVEGPPEALKALTADRLHAFIDVRARKPENDLPFFEKLIVQGLPEGVRMSREVVVTAKFKLPASKPPENPAP